MEAAQSTARAEDAPGGDRDGRIMALSHYTAMRHAQIFKVLALVAVFATVPRAEALAQTGLPGLLRDIATAPSPVFAHLLQGPFAPVAMGGELYFPGWDQTEGLELRASDGTPAGTRTVRDVCPGSCNGFHLNFELVESGGVLYFVGDDGARGRELWRSDGTRAGTWMVVEIVPGADHEAPLFLAPAPGGVYFVGSDAAHGRELWWSDGTAAGTHLVADLLPGNPAGLHEGPSHLTWLPGIGLFFTAEDGVHGREPWITQGTAATTALLADVRPGATGSLSAYLPWPRAWYAPVVAGGQLFFGADDGTHGLEPWVSDGTPAGTALVADLVPGVEGSEPYAFFAFGDDVLFNAGVPGTSRTLWRSDGTAAGTTVLGDAAHGSENLSPRGFSALGGVVYFGGYHTTAGYELWRTDGTLAGTQVAVELIPGAGHGLQAWRSITSAGGRIWFVATDGVHGVEWWQSDGTAGGTFPVGDLVPGSGSSADFTNADIPAAIGGRVLFSAWDPARIYAVRAAEPGVAGSTVVQSAGDRPGSAPSCVLGNCPIVMAPVDDGVAFTAFEGVHGAEAWRTDGTDTGTRLVADVLPGIFSSLFPYYTNRNLASFGNDLLLIAEDDGGPTYEERFQLRRADPAGNVTELTDEPWTAPLGELASWSNTGSGAGYFAAPNGVWKSDGTPAGSGVLSPAATNARWFVPAANHLYFAAGRLWKSDGTPGGTAPLAPALDYGPNARPVRTDDGAGHDLLYFAGGDAAGGSELWTSDGTDAGTRRVVDLRPGPASSVPILDLVSFEEQSLLAAIGPKAFFVADDGAAGEELWVSDGSPGNATLLEVRLGAAGSQPRHVTAAGGRVYFVADDGVHGREPWVTDGTPAGTQLLRDVRPGPESSTPKELVEWMGRLVFAADDDVHGMELWRADESGDDAQLVVDLRPGVAPSSPQGLTAIGEKLYFFADDGTTGLEPRMWSAAVALFTDGFESGNQARWSRSTSP